MPPALQPWTLVEKVVCWEVWQADMSRVILRIEKPVRLDEQPGVGVEAHIIAVAPVAVRLLAELVSVMKHDALLMIDPELIEIFEPAVKLLASIPGERVHAS